MDQCLHKLPSLTRDAWPYSTRRESGKSRRPMASEQQINILPRLLAIKMLQQISLANQLTHQSATPPTSGSNDEHKPITADIKVDHYLWGDWEDPCSYTKQTLDLRVGFISSHLAAHNFFTVNPRAITDPATMSLRLDHQKNAYSCCALIWPWLVHNVKPAGTDARSNPQQDCQQTKCYVMKQGRSCNAATTVFKLTWSFRKTLLLTNKICNSLSHLNDNRQRGVIWVTYGCYKSDPN